MNAPFSAASSSEQSVSSSSRCASRSCSHSSLEVLPSHPQSTYRVSAIFWLFWTLLDIAEARSPASGDPDR